MNPPALRERLAKQGEDALGRFAQELLENPLITGALTKAFDARERAVQAQEAAMGALNLPSAADLERLTRRIRSLAQRLEGIEDALDRIDERLGTQAGGSAETRLEAIEKKLDDLMRAQTASAKAGASAARASASAAKASAKSKKST